MQIPIWSLYDRPTSCQLIQGLHLFSRIASKYCRDYKDLMILAEASLSYESWEDFDSFLELIHYSYDFNWERNHIQEFQKAKESNVKKILQGSYGTKIKSYIPEIPSLLTQAKVETTLRKDLNDLQIKHETEIKEQTKLLAESQAHNLQQQKYNEQMIAQVNFSNQIYTLKS